MGDQKPPRLASDERSTLWALLDYQRNSFLRKVEGTDDEQARRSPVTSGTSLLWLLNHLADAEASWVLRRFAGIDQVGFPAEGATTVRASVERYRGVTSAVDAELERAGSLDAICPPFDDGASVNLRWIVTHLVEETARHAGHADILRELIDHQVGR